MIAAVLFDCDGVLLDTERLANEINAELLREAGIPMTYKECRSQLSGKSDDQVRQWLQNKYGFLPSTLEAGATEWSERFVVGVQKLKPVMPGAKELLANMTLPYAVVTNSSGGELTFKFQETEMDPYFPDHLRFSGIDLNMPKPAPGAYLSAAEALGVAPENCLVIEDTVTGVTAGKNAGMTVWGFSIETDEQVLLEAGCERCFNHLNQLLELIETENTQG